MATRDENRQEKIERDRIKAERKKLEAEKKAAEKVKRPATEKKTVKKPAEKTVQKKPEAFKAGNKVFRTVPKFYPNPETTPSEKKSDSEK